MSGGRVERETGPWPVVGQILGVVEMIVSMNAQMQTIHEIRDHER